MNNVLTKSENRRRYCKFSSMLVQLNETRSLRSSVFKIILKKKIKEKFNEK